MFQYFLVFIIAFVAALLLTPLAKFLSYHFNILDRPGERKIHSAPIPLMGGVAILGSLILALLFSGIEWKILGAVFLVGSFFVGFGLLDDGGLKVKARYKIWSHLAFAFLFVYLSGISFRLFNIWWLDWVLSVCFITFMTNSMNMLDGMDGLVSGIVFFASLFFLIIALKEGQNALALVCLSVMGATLGFLKSNFNPASIFLGEGGSTLLGGFLAGLTIEFSNLSLLSLRGHFWVTYHVWTSLIVCLIILGIPIFDTYFVFANRFWNHIKFSTPGKDHAHHRLHLMGLSHRDTVLILYAMQLVLGAVALIMLNADRLQFLSLLIILLILAFAAWLFLGQVKVYSIDSTLPQESC